MESDTVPAYSWLPPLFAVTFTENLQIMKRLIFCTMCTAFFLCQGNAQSPEEMQKWQAYMTPSSMQEMMGKWDGEWKEDITMWMAPGAPEQKMTSTCVNKMILGGRYQQSKHEGNFMGMPFEGKSLTGWDNTRKVFVSSWIDNFGTGMIYMEGTWDPATKSMTATGKMTDPMSGEEKNIKQVLHIVDDNTQTLEQYLVDNGTEFKTMLIKLTRKK